MSASGNAGKEGKAKDLLAEKSNASLEDEARTLKKQKDYMPEILELIPSLTSSISSSSSVAELEAVLSELYAWEKKTRLASDADSTKLLAETILDCCVKQGNWTALNENIVLLSKRRAQLVKVVKAVVVHAMTFLKICPSSAEKKELIATLRAVSDGKIFLELERAELTKILASMYEAEGDIAKASDVLQEIAVETVGSMEFLDRADFLLEQLRLSLAKRDWLRAELTSKKLRTKQFSNPDWVDVRLRFNTLMIQFYAQKGDYLELARCWKVIYDINFAKSLAELEAKHSTDPKDKDIVTKNEKDANTSSKSDMEDTIEASEPRTTDSLLEDRGFLDNETTAKWRGALTKAILYTILSPLDYESREIAGRIASETKALGSVPAYAALLNAFMGEGVVSWPLEGADGEPIEDEIKSNSIFSSSSTTSGKSASSSSTSMVDSVEETNININKHTGEEIWTLLKSRVLQKNLSVASTRYTRVRMSRLSQLFNSTQAEVETALGEMISAKQIVAKLDAPHGEVVFSTKKPSSESLDEWSARLASLLALVENTANLVHKENMHHGVKTRM